MRHFCATLYATPPGFALIFFGAVPGVWGFESSLSTPSQAAPCGAPVFASRFARLLRRGRPPPGYFMAPRGSNLGSRLRCCAATPWQALALAKLPHHHPYNFRFIGGGCPLHAYTNAHPGDGVGVWLRGGQYNSLSFETGPQKRTGEPAFCCSLRDSKCLRAHIILRFSLVRRSEERLLPLVSTTK